MKPPGLRLLRSISPKVHGSQLLCHPDLLECLSEVSRPVFDAWCNRPSVYQIELFSEAPLGVQVLDEEVTVIRLPI